jgi:hypothetical protein
MCSERQHSWPTPALYAVLACMGLLLILAPTTGASRAAPAATPSATPGNTGRHAHSALLLKTGQVLVIGSSVQWELYDPSTSTWRTTGSSCAGYSPDMPVLLLDGRVFVGGMMIYDPALGNCKLVKQITRVRTDATATLLPDGRVLVLGGLDSGHLGPGETRYVDNEIYNPVTDTWSAAGSLLFKRYGHTAIGLRDGVAVLGAVLVFGGMTEPGPDWPYDEVFDPVTGTSKPAGTLIHFGAGRTATLLPDGRVLVAGGVESDLYDPVTNSWRSAGAMRDARMGHTATLLADGRVLVTGGAVDSRVLASAEMYNPATNTWNPAGEMHAARRGHTATLLPSGQVLILEGVEDASAPGTEIYDPSSGTWRVGARAQYGPRILSGTAVPGDAPPPELGWILIGMALVPIAAAALLLMGLFFGIRHLVRRR